MTAIAARGDLRASGPLALPGGGILGVAAGGLILASILFNAALSILNAWVLPLNGAMFTAVQGMLLAAALLVGVAGGGDMRARWIAVLWCMLLWWLFLSVLRQSLIPKSLGDIATFPIFALLGGVIRHRTILRLVIAVQALVLVVGLWEAVDPAGYARLLNVASYYTNTRGVGGDEFWSEYEGLYLNSVRPVGRLFLPQLNIHRVSSLFLEPVSLGNWTVVIAVILTLFWSRLSWAERIFLFVSNAALLVLCDGRFAALGIVCVVGAVTLARWLPRWLPMLFPAFVLGGLVIARRLGALPSGGDTITGRLAKSLAYFERMTFEQAMGLVDPVPGWSFDSGWTYFSMTQSIIGMVLFWIALVFMMPKTAPLGRQLVYGITAFFALNMPVSNSFISIKAAALLFALYGSLMREAVTSVNAAAPQK